jgi:hypothetical protein
MALDIHHMHTKDTWQVYHTVAPSTAQRRLVLACPAAFGLTLGAVAHWKKLQRPTPGGPAGRAQV